MNRYNQSFGKFGPMEQEWNGKWVKHEDVVPLEKTIKELREKNASLDHTAELIESNYWLLWNKSERYIVGFWASIIINVISLFAACLFLLSNTNVIN